MVSEDMKPKMNSYIKPESLLTIYLKNGGEITTPCAVKAEGFLAIWDKHLRTVRIPINSHSYLTIKKNCVASFIIKSRADYNNESYPFEEFK